MSVEFAEDQTYQQISPPVRQDVFTKVVIRMGLAKDGRGANIVLLCTAIVSIVAAILIVVSNQVTNSGVPQQIYDSHVTQPQSLPR